MTQSFYEAVLPPEGPYCILSISPAGSTFPTFFNDLDAAVAYGDEISERGNNAYFALASYIDEAGGRKAANAKALRSLFLDIDCGVGKPYADHSAAAIALRAFVEKHKFPMPYIVNSGGGLHVYWPFEEAIDVNAWAPLARRFKTMCVSAGLHIDPAVPADAARVLRMPGTRNVKKGNSLVCVLRNGVVSPVATLRALIPSVDEPDLSAARGHGMDAMTKALAGDDFPPTSFKRIVRKSLVGSGCAQIANACENAATLEEPLWRAALSIAWRCTDAETSIHTLSRPHPEYTPEATVKKAEETKGPMTCQWYKDNYPSTCAGCQHKITSPISLGRKIEAAELVGDTYVVEHQLEADNTDAASQHLVKVEIPAFPQPYFRGLSGGVYMRTKDEKGEPIEVQVYPYDLYLTSRFYDSTENGDGDGEVVGVNLHTPHDGIRRFTAPVSTLLTQEKMRDLLLKHGVVAINKELGVIMAYLASSIRNLQKMFAADRTRNQMGWTPDEAGFVIGELEHTRTGTRLAPAASGTKQLAPLLMQKGSLEEWTKMVDFYNNEGMEAHAAGVFVGFGAPLLRLFGGVEVRGATINLMSNKSGTGKTTAQMVANSIFGHPSALLMKQSDTVASKMHWLSMMNNLVCTMDEVTNIPDEILSDLLYDIPQGRAKHRMEAQTNKLRPNALYWQTFVLMSSNSSLSDKLLRLKSTADGELRRLIELRITRPNLIAKEESDRVFGALNDNYGLAGPVFINYVMNNRERVVELMQSIQRKVDKDLTMDQSDRFYSVVLSCIFAGAIIARDLGLHHIAIERVYEYTIKAVGNFRSEVLQPVSNVGAAALETLGQYINENLGNTLVMNSVIKGPNGELLAPLNQVRGPLRMRYEPDTQEMWIPSAALREYFVSRQVDVRAAINQLSTDKVLKHNGNIQVKRLGAGMLGNFETAGVRCFCIDGKFLGVDPDMFIEPPVANDESAG